MMVAFNFDLCMANRVKDGRKRQTIRKPRASLRVGCPLQLYTEMRTKYCRKVLETVCTDVAEITIGDEHVEIGGRELDYATLRELAWRDGFVNPDEMFHFFKRTYTLPLSGNVIRWRVRTFNSDVVFGGLDLSFHVSEQHRSSMEFMDQLVASGLSLYRTEVGATVGIMEWNWDQWAHNVYSLPGFVMDGIPVRWRPVDWRDGQATVREASLVIR